MSMHFQENEQNVAKEDLSRQLHQDGSALSRYKQKVLGDNKSYLRLLQLELSQILCANLGGGLGYLLRKWTFASLFQSCGSGVILGRGLILRKPGNIYLGSNIAIDDQTLLDGGTGVDCSIRIGNDTVISKGSVIQAKTGPLEIGDGCDIGAHVIIASIGGIILAPNVLIAGNCYIGGARYHLESTATPIMYQGIYSRGQISIGTGTWIGASAMILDGVSIGKNCVIGAGSLVTKDIPNFATAVGSPARVINNRNERAK
jgi:acetyltransferase-like isoleucine patch superfamily enzyme